MAQDTNNANNLPSLIRKCRDCANGEMHLTAMQLNMGEQTQLFECQSCGTKLQMPSAGFIGLQFWVWLIVSWFLIWIFLIDTIYVSPTTYVFVLGFVAAGACWCLGDVIRHFYHPLIKVQNSIQPSHPTNRPSRSFIVKILNMGFFTTPLAVLGIAIAILGLAALAGYINDYVL